MKDWKKYFENTDTTSSFPDGVTVPVMVLREGCDEPDVSLDGAVRNRLAAMNLSEQLGYCALYDGEPSFGHGAQILAFGKSYKVTEKSPEAALINRDGILLGIVFSDEALLFGESIRSYSVSLDWSDSLSDPEYGYVSTPCDMTLLVSPALYETEEENFHYDPWRPADTVELSVPEGIKNIMPFAFRGLSRLERVTLPRTLLRICHAAFRDCKALAKIELAQGLEFIGDEAFMFCEALRAVKIPDTVTSVGDHAFACCSSLTEVSLPSGISIGKKAFYDCPCEKDIT